MPNVQAQYMTLSVLVGAGIGIGSIIALISLARLIIFIRASEAENTKWTVVFAKGAPWSLALLYAMVLGVALPWHFFWVRGGTPHSLVMWVFMDTIGILMAIWAASVFGVS